MMSGSDAQKMRCEMLYAEDKIKREKLQKMMDEKAKKRQSVDEIECTFKPYLNKSKSPIRSSWTQGEKKHNYIPSNQSNNQFTSMT